MSDVQPTGATVTTTTTTGGESKSVKACVAKVPDFGLRKHKGQHKLPKKETRLEYFTHALTELFQEFGNCWRQHLRRWWQPRRRRLKVRQTNKHGEHAKTAVDYELQLLDTLNKWAPICMISLKTQIINDIYIVFNRYTASGGGASLFRLLCTPSRACSFCCDSVPPTGIRQLPSFAEERRWVRGKGTSPLSSPPHLAVAKTGGVNPRRRGNSRRFPESINLLWTGEARKIYSTK